MPPAAARRRPAHAAASAAMERSEAPSSSPMDPPTSDRSDSSGYVSVSVQISSKLEKKDVRTMRGKMELEIASEHLDLNLTMTSYLPSVPRSSLSVRGSSFGVRVKVQIDFRETVSQIGPTLRA